MSNEDLVQRLQNGEEVFSLLLDKNIGWIRKQAKKHSDYSLFEYGDLENYFTYLLHQSAHKFEAERGAKFITFFALVIKTQFIKMVTKPDYINLERQTVSLNKTIPMLPKGGVLEFMDTIPSPHGNVTYLSVLIKVMKDILTNHMNPRGVDIAMRYLVDGVNTIELAKEYGVTRESTSAYVRKARKILIEELPKHGYQY